MTDLFKSAHDITFTFFLRHTTASELYVTIYSESAVTLRGKKKNHQVLVRLVDHDLQVLM